MREDAMPAGPTITGKCVAITPVGGPLDSLTGTQVYEYLFEANAAGISPAIVNQQLTVRTAVPNYAYLNQTYSTSMQPI
jgi:hypothetical protein